MPDKLRICALFILIIIIVAPASAQAIQSPAPSPEKQVTQERTQDLVPAHPATVEQIHEYYRLTHAIEGAHRIMDQMVAGMQATSAPYFPKAFWDDMKTAFASLDIETAFISAYQKYFSEEEMASVIDFYKSPAGQHLLESQPFIESAAGDQLRKAGQTIGHEVYLRHKDEIEAAKKKYDMNQAPPSQTDQKK